MTLLLICGFVLTLSAGVRAQDQMVTLKVEGSTFKEVIAELKRQTQLDFFYSFNEVDVNRPVSLDVKNERIDDVLRLLLGSRFTWEYQDDIVIIKPTQADDEEEKKSVTVKGFVYDEKKQPMPGVTVQVVGTSVGTATNEKGWFFIGLPMLKGELRFSFVGYRDKGVAFTEQTANDTLRIHMEANVEELDEAVVVAYGETTRRMATGSISVVKADELQGIPATSIASLLQGRVAGLDITQMSGSPGGGGTAVVIRGYNSFDVEQGRRFSDPLWVVDGVPLNAFDSPVTGTNLLSDINPDMIESIQVLKDASAASLYGSRAANGVIIVTTKKGAMNSKATFSANVSHTWSWVPELPTITVGKAEREARLRALANTRTAYLNDETQWWTYPTSNKEVFDQKDGSYDYFFSHVAGMPNTLIYQDSLNTFYNNQTNFFPAYFQTGKVLNANLQAYGGGEAMSYGIGLGFYDESGVAVGTGFQRVDLNSTLNVVPVERLSVDLRMNASLITRKRGEKSEVLGSAPSIETVPGDPFWESSLYPGEGTEAWEATLDALRGTKEKNRSVRLRSSFKLGYEPIDGLDVTAMLAADYAIHRRNYFQPSYLDEDGFSISVGETAINLMVLNEDIVSYRRTFKEDHNLNVMAGFSYEYNQMEYNGGSAENSPSDKIYYAPWGMPDLGYVDQWGTEVAVAFQHYQSDMTEKKLISFFGRAEYNYKQKYLLTASIRWDGSSVFGKDCRWGTFPSVAAGWTFSEERLLKENVGWLSFGKLRASWGRSGKQFEAPYRALGLMVTGEFPEYGNPTLVPDQSNGIYNNGLSWEETDQYDLGVDLDFLDYRLGVTVDYYYRYTDKLLFNSEVAGDYNYYSTQWRNAGAISNEGLEVLVKYEILRSPELYWKVSVNGARNWNRVEESIDGKDLSANFVTGKSLNNIQGFLTEGYVNNQEDVQATFTGNEAIYLYPDDSKYRFYTLGDRILVDVNGDGAITADDDRVTLGSALPYVTGGLVSEFQWKNIDVNIVFSYSIGRHMVNEQRIHSLSFATDPQSNFYAHPLLLDYGNSSFWEQPGDNDATYPLLQLMGKYQYDIGYVFDYQVEKVNYLKLRTLTVGYNLPERITERLHLAQVRVFATGENLWNWNNYSGLDPETVSIQDGLDFGENYPLARKFTLGLTVKF